MNRLGGRTPYGVSEQAKLEANKPIPETAANANGTFQRPDITGLATLHSHAA